MDDLKFASVVFIEIKKAVEELKEFDYYVEWNGIIDVIKIQ